MPPCKLVIVSDPPPDFRGNVGDEVQLAVSGTNGTAIIKSASYAGQPLSAPWKFTIQQGTKTLALLVENSLPRDVTLIQEVCDDATKNTLWQFLYRAQSPAHLFDVDGTAGGGQ